MQNTEHQNRGISLGQIITIPHKYPHRIIFSKFPHVHSITSVMIYHRRASLNEQTDLLICHCTKQDLSRTSRYVDKPSPEIARYHIHMPTARAATLSVVTYA